ncbi:MAG: hypothetical protein EP330_22600 [Deltaproteobacteria bacterium]|nr:MAG: hypothetical protein EP330_22600 [Deltaproteobacteria bacterium]
MAAESGPYGRLARFVLARKRLVAVSAAVIAVLSVIIGVPPEVDSNLLTLLPKDDPAASALMQLHEEEGGFNLLTLAFESDDPAKLEAYLPELVADLEELDTVRYVLHDIDAELAQRVGLLQLDPSDVEELSARVKGALALGSALNPLVTSRLMAMGPVAERIGQASDKRVLSNSGEFSRVLIKPTGSSHDQPFTFKFMGQIDEVLAEHDPEAAGVKLAWMGGSYRHNVEDVTGVKQDIARTSGASALLVLLVLAVTFRSPRAIVLVFVPLVIANLINLATAELAIGSLNTYTSFGTAILIGLGIDFAVHLVGRYREQRASGSEVEDAIAEAWDLTGPPCTTAALTSAAGFLALSVADFRGFAQLGVLLATGLVVCLGAMLVLLPVLIAWLDPDPPVLLGTKTEQAVSTSDYRLAPLGLMLLVTLTAMMGVAKIPDIEFEFDSSTLRNDGLAYDELSEAERALARESYAPVVITYPDAASLAKAHVQVNRDIAEDKYQYVAAAVSMETVLPSDQAVRIEALKELAALANHPNLRYLPPPIAKPLVELRGYTGEAVTREQLPGALVDFLGGDERHRLLVFPKGNMWDLTEAAAFSAEIAELAPGRPAAGEYTTLGSLYNLVRTDMPVIAGLALFLVCALTFIDLKKVHWAAGAIGTLLSGMVWAGAAVQTLGVKLSILNVVGIPILLGIGVDVVIHLLHRLKEEGPGGVRRAMATTGVAASVSTLTTILSFLSLLLAGNRGVRDLGLLVVVGLSAVFLASAVMLPMAWAAGWRVTGRAPGDNGDDD